MSIRESSGGSEKPFEIDVNISNVTISQPISEATGYNLQFWIIGCFVRGDLSLCTLLYRPTIGAIWSGVVFSGSNHGYRSDLVSGCIHGFHHSMSDVAIPKLSFLEPPFIFPLELNCPGLLFPKLSWPSRSLSGLLIRTVSGCSSHLTKWISENAPFALISRHYNAGHWLGIGW
jgi:hypothetical protein